MTKRLGTIEQAMELSIQHHIPPPAVLDSGQAAGAEAMRLEAYLDTLPARFAQALRSELAKGSLTVTLVAGTGAIRVSPVKPRRKRSGRKACAPGNAEKGL